jgi:hypothetical protein
VKDPIQLLIEAGALPATTYPPTSRYAGVLVHTHEPGDGRLPVAYLARRLVPAPERLAAVGEYPVEEGDRLDLIAARRLGDPELWWRLADANPTVDPTSPPGPVGRRLRITLPDGMPGGGGDAG